MLNPSPSVPHEPIRVLIVDDQAMVRSGLRFFLLAFEDLKPIGEATRGEEALELCAQARPDVVLMEVTVPGLDAASTTRAIHRRFPHVKVIALTGFNGKDLVQEVLESGAAGYLLKNVSAEQLADAIRAAHAGQPVPALIPAASQPSAPGGDLTRRQLEVLTLLAGGLSDGEIAARLAIRPSTVRSHLRNIRSRLGARSRAQAVALALQHRPPASRGGDLDL